MHVMAMKYICNEKYERIRISPSDRDGLAVCSSRSLAVVLVSQRRKRKRSIGVPSLCWLIPQSKKQILGPKPRAETAEPPSGERVKLRIFAKLGQT